ncbi:MAG: hypothetical protein HYY24_24450 [Verrucomicrobia bacterium]|nr:hypothetical protein [Verrucomicrobiota bacterium]
MASFKTASRPARKKFKLGRALTSGEIRKRLKLGKPGDYKIHELLKAAQTAQVSQKLKARPLAPVGNGRAGRW